MSLLTIDEALAAVLAAAQPLPPFRVHLDDAANLLVEEDVRADIDSPPFDKALMDGYALGSLPDAKADADAEPAPDPRSRRYAVVGPPVHAGETPDRPLAPGQALPVMTGAPVPQGARAVVPREQAEILPPSPDDQAAAILALPDQLRLPPDANILRRGRETRAGDVVVPAGSRLNPARLAVLASVGHVRPLVRPRPRVAVLATGDELVPPSETPGPGRIRNSNSTLLRHLVERWGGMPRVHPPAPDQPRALTALLERALRTADVLLVSGGVSAGDRDLVPAALQSLGVRNVFHKIRVKPGKPLWFGVATESAPRPETTPDPDVSPAPPPLVFGLPGNPVSSLVSFLLFVRPAIAKLSGLPHDRPAETFCQLAETFQQRGDRPTYHPAVILRDDNHQQPAFPQPRLPRVKPLPWLGSADLRAVADADGFVYFPPGDQTYPPGWTSRFLLL